MFRRRAEHSLINCELIASEGEITSRWKRDKDLILFVLVGRSFELADFEKRPRTPEEFHEVEYKVYLFLMLPKMIHELKQVLCARFMILQRFKTQCRVFSN